MFNRNSLFIQSDIIKQLSLWPSGQRKAFLFHWEGSISSSLWSTLSNIYCDFHEQCSIGGLNFALKKLTLNLQYKILPEVKVTPSSQFIVLLIFVWVFSRGLILPPPPPVKPTSIKKPVRNRVKPSTLMYNFQF